MKFLREAFLFGVCGVLGFVVDVAVLYRLQDYLGPFVARGFSFVAAVIMTWMFNRSITFKSRRSGMKKHNEFFSYFFLMLAGGVFNYAVYAWMVLAYEIVSKNLFIGVAFGSLAGMFVNYSTSRFMLFRRDVEN